MADPEQNRAAVRGKIITKASRDPVFKAKLMADPHAAMKEAGVNVPAGVTVSVLEDSDTHFHLVLPAEPAALSDAQLDAVAAGDSDPTTMPGIPPPPPGIPWDKIKLG